eukprot:scaffold236110_cov20-Tisochrysis_lutea.AAC.2
MRWLLGIDLGHLDPTLLLHAMNCVVLTMALAAPALARQLLGWKPPSFRPSNLVITRDHLVINLVITRDHLLINLVINLVITWSSTWSSLVTTCSSPPVFQAWPPLNSVLDQP